MERERKFLRKLKVEHLYDPAILSPKVGSHDSLFRKPVKRPGRWKGNLLHFRGQQPGSWGAGVWAGGRLSSSRAPADRRRARALVEEGGPLAETAQSALARLLKSALAGLTTPSRLFQCSSSSVPRSACVHLSEASPGDRGSWCRGYSPIIT